MGFKFEERDLTLLEKTMRLRERMMDNIAMVEDSKLPTKPSDIMAVTNLLESIDRSILGKAKIEIEGDAAKDQQATKELLRQLVLDIHTNGDKARLPTEALPAAQLPEYIPFREMTVSQGELITRSDNYTGEE